MQGLRWHIETVSFVGPYAKVRGWMFHAEAEIVRLRLGLHGDGAASGVDAFLRIPRVDVANGTGNVAASYSGFWCDGLVCSGTQQLVATVWMQETQQELCVELGLVEPSPDGYGWRFVAGAFVPYSHTPAGVTKFGPLPAGLHAASVLAACRGGELPLDYRPCRPVTLLTSVYQGGEFLEDFFRTVAIDIDFYDEFVVVDNGNLDEGLMERLRAFVGENPKAMLVRQDNNHGYIAGICKAFENRRCNGHVIVLNTDIVLPSDWVRRLIWPLDGFQDVATTTPFTNAGTVASFPRMPLDNPIYLGLSVDEIDPVFKQVRADVFLPSLPSGVGFCMAMHADRIAELGWFDLITYGFGYGEENDWCLKAAMRGYRNVLVPNLFVYHKHGGVYPSETKQALIARNLRVIQERFPFFDAWVRSHIDEDPGEGVRSWIAFQLAAKTNIAAVSVREVSLASKQIRLPHDGPGPWLTIVEVPTSRTWVASFGVGGGSWCLWGWGGGEKTVFRTAFEQLFERSPTDGITIT